MREIRPIEGFFIETPEGLIFDVKGVYHPIDRIIAYLRYYPSTKGNRVRGKFRYARVYDLGERRQWLLAHYPEYLWQCDQWGLEVQAVPNSLAVVHDPRRKLEDFAGTPSEDLSVIEHNILDLGRFLQTIAPFPSEVGVTGSILVDLAVSDSDFDLVVFGIDNCLAIHDQMDALFEQEEGFTRYSHEEMLAHYKRRGVGSGVPLEIFAFHELRKTHQGRFRGTDFFLRYVPFPDELPWDFSTVRYVKVGPIRVLGEVCNADTAIFTPCSYGVAIRDITQRPALSIDPELITEVVSFRGRFCEQLSVGEDFACQGTLECVSDPNGVHYRVLLGNQPSDYLVVDGGIKK